MNKANLSDKINLSWAGEAKQYKGFCDYGNYLIGLPDYDDPSVQNVALEAINKALDHGDITKIGCSCMVKRNSEGEVVVGRNMDLFVSQKPAYVFCTTFGKYKNFCVSYTSSSGPRYDELLNAGEIDDVWRARLAYIACDCMNEKGLYVEVDMRTGYPGLSNYGLHSARGEKCRDDGTPWKDLRACLLSVPQIVTQNCATVDEAVKFLANSYDWYTTGMPYNPTYDGWNYAFIMGDATGEYGLVEIAQDEISYIPYQFAQANYYITPKWNVLDVRGTGQGRVNAISKVIRNVETLDEAMEAMKASYWKHVTMWIGESERIEDGTRPNPYNQIEFKDDEGNPQLDWRSDYEGSFTVLDDGRLMLPEYMYEQAAECSYDPAIKKYFDDALRRGTMVIDDGSMRFEVDGGQYSTAELFAKYSEYLENWNNPEKQNELRPFYNALDHLTNNMNSLWYFNDRNFEAMKAIIYAQMHMRYNKEGEFDLEGMSKYDKLCAFYGKGVAKDENPLRDDATVWTTSLNVGANCAKKEIKVRFWENDGLVVNYAFGA